MGADIKSLRVRIKSVNSTLHLTKAMGLVASSKIKKALSAMSKSREYEKSFRDVCMNLASSSECRKSPYVRGNEGKHKIIVIAGDRGLAGGYNANIFRLMRELPEAEIIPIGKRACDRYGKKFISSEHFAVKDAYEIAEKLCREFMNGETGKVSVVYTRYVSAMTQLATVEDILPLPTDNEPAKGMLFEPDELTVLNSAVPGYLAGRIVSAVKESFACEVVARRTAMDSAGKNAEQMIDNLTLEYNRARQGAITQEINEIVAGSGE